METSAVGRQNVVMSGGRVGDGKGTGHAVKQLRLHPGSGRAGCDLRVSGYLVFFLLGVLFAY